MSFLTKLFGDPNKRVIAGLQPLVAKINALEPSFVSLSDAALREKTQEFRDRLTPPHSSLHKGEKEGVALDDLLPEAFAAVREAARRTLGQRHFDVQLIGGMVLHRGEIAEMRTGEGKTLTATLPVYLNALAGRGVHVVTVNDYLAKRDSVWMGQIYHALGLTVGCIQHESAFLYDPHFRAPSPTLSLEGRGEGEGDHAHITDSFRIHTDYLRPVQRKEAYVADITYGTNNEFGFDYLRDNMVRDTRQMVQRDLHYAIVDEVDSILIDEARTPLIISAPAEESTDRYYQFADMVRRLTPIEDYNIDEKMRASTFTEAGQDKITRWLNFDPWTSLDAETIYHLEAALKAHALYAREREYVVKEGEVIIVDEFTGRLMFGRRYSEGLHQAIEAKEGVKIQRESRTLATITFQNYFRLYAKLAGMTGTAVTEAEEFAKIYNLDVTVIPTNKPMIRADMADRVYATEKGKFMAVVKAIKERHEKGQPVLVGTISIEKNELLSDLLSREGVPHEVLNAKNHEREAEIIAQAGRTGAVTVATNMAGRGVDIILGGNPPDANEAAKVRACDGVLVLGTERHESRRIDNQLRGRSGRQGDPGSSQFYVSMEDDLMRIFGPDRMKNLMQKMGLPEDMPVENTMVSRAIESAQRKVEGHNFDIRKHLLEYDDVLNKHREVFYRKRREVLAAAEQAFSPSSGGGDKEGVDTPAFSPSSGGGDKEGVDTPALSPSSGGGDKEGVDTPALFPSSGGGDKEGVDTPVLLRDLVFEMVEGEIEQVVLFHTASESEKEWNLDEVIEVMRTMLPLTAGAEDQIRTLRREAGSKLADVEARTSIIETLVGIANAAYDEQLKYIGDPAISRELVKSLILQAMDTLWIEHLDAMHHLRTGIGLRGYGQRDPLVEYKREAYRMFNELMAAIQKQVAYTIFKISAAVRVAETGTRGLLDRAGLRLSAPAKTMGGAGLSPSSGGGAGGGGSRVTPPSMGGVGEGGPGQSKQKIGRNDPCPCGAKKEDGTPKKYKHCHGNNA